MAVAPLLHQCFKLGIVPIGQDNPGGDEQVAGPASFLMYEGASGERFTVYSAKTTAGTTQMRYAAQGKDTALFWADRGVGFVVSGSVDRDRLTQIAKLIYDQSEKIGG